MDKITHKIRISKWRSIIEQCQPRPKGQSAKQWLADNGISEKTYYYWQRKVLQETYALIKQDAVSPAKPESDTSLLPLLKSLSNLHKKSDSRSCHLSFIISLN